MTGPVAAVQRTGEKLGNILIICRRQLLFGDQVKNFPQIHVALRWTRRSREVSPYFCTLWTLQMFSVNVTRREERSILLNIIYIAQAATAAWYKTTKTLFSDSFFYALENFEEMISFVMSVRPSVRLFACNNLDPTWRIFMLWYFRIFRKCFEKIRVSLNLARIAVTLDEDPQHAVTPPRNI